eukprot:364825-Chlamydomonas_euryale.AAC.5
MVGSCLGVCSALSVLVYQISPKGLHPQGARARCDGRHQVCDNLFAPPPAPLGLWDSWKWYCWDGYLPAALRFCALPWQDVGCSCGSCAGMRMQTPSHACFALTIAVLLASFCFPGLHALHAANPLASPLAATLTLTSL